MRSIGIAAGVVAAAGLLLAGCGAKDCQKELGKLDKVPTSCPTVAPGATVGVPIQLCATCPYSEPSCVAVYDNVGAGNGAVQLEPYVALCDAQASCPTPQESCSYSCEFKAPTVPGTYDLVIIDAADTYQRVPFVVQDGAVGTSCS